MEEIKNLTGLRAFAATSVVLLHMRPLMSSESNPLDFIFANGGNGVQVFFVLSGFILAYQHADRFRDDMTWRSWSFFVWLRLARIYPVHLFLLLVIASNVLPVPVSATDTMRAFLANLTLTQAWGAIDYLSFNEPAWTISAEWFAYLLFPLLAWATGRLHPLMWIAIAAGSAMLLPSFAIYGMSYGAAAVVCLLHFAVGFMAYLLCRRLPDWRLFWRIAAVAMGPTLVLLVVHTLGMEVFAVATAFFIAALFKAGPVFAYANPVSVYMGRISYSLYMVHKPLLAVFLTMASGTPPIIIIAAMIAAAALLYHLVEEPARRTLQRINPARRVAVGERALGNLV